MGRSAIPDVDGVRHSYRTVGGIRLHVAEAGEGPALVLLHGWPQHWYVWHKLIPSLSRQYRVICPDLRGLGESDAPARGYDKETMARDIISLLDDLGIERCHLVGHDYGVGSLVCLFAPDRVERFVALNIALPFARPNVGGMLGAWRLWYQWVLAAPFVGYRTVRRLADNPGVIGAWAGTGRAWDDDLTRVYSSQLREPSRARASVQFYRTFQLRDLPWMMSGRYRRIGLRTPTLVLHGLDDRVVRPSNLSVDERSAGRLSVELVEGCGHFIVDERPDLVLDRTLSFFAGGQPAPGGAVPA
jgi:pimeloyl-ACP methyl ester carboxylesterase